MISINLLPTVRCGGGCGRKLRANNFYWHRQAKGHGRWGHSHCTDCVRAYAASRDATPEGQLRVARLNAERYGEHRKARTAANQKARSRTADGRVERMLAFARQRAKAAGVPFAITRDHVDIPLRCPIFGIEIRLTGQPEDRKHWPTLDRIVPERGYVPCNVAVMSYAANEMKGSGTAEQHEAIAAWIRANRPA